MYIVHPICQENISYSIIISKFLINSSNMPYVRSGKRRRYKLIGSFSYWRTSALSFSESSSLFLLPLNGLWLLQYRRLYLHKRIYVTGTDGLLQHRATYTSESDDHAVSSERRQCRVTSRYKGDQLYRETDIPGGDVSGGQPCSSGRVQAGRGDTPTPPAGPGLTISWSSSLASGHRLRSIVWKRPGHTWRSNPEPPARSTRRSVGAAERDRGTRANKPTVPSVDAMADETRAWLQQECGRPGRPRARRRAHEDAPDR